MLITRLQSKKGGFEKKTPHKAKQPKAVNKILQLTKGVSKQKSQSSVRGCMLCDQRVKEETKGVDTHKEGWCAAFTKKLFSKYLPFFLALALFVVLIFQIMTISKTSKVEAVAIENPEQETVESPAVLLQ